jgi:hypothetical protein
MDKRLMRISIREYLRPEWARLSKGVAHFRDTCF